MVWDGDEEWCGMGMRSGVGWGEEWCGMGMRSGVGWG